MTDLVISMVMPMAHADLTPDEPLLQLAMRSPQPLDASLLPVLVGPPGEGTAAPPVSRTLTWTNGQLTGIAFADGRSKSLTWTGDQLTRVDHVRPSQPTLRADLTYSPDGLVQAVSVSQLP